MQPEIGYHRVTMTQSIESASDAIRPQTATAVTVTPDQIGSRTGTAIPVELSTRFLEHFSEQLYSSPQKAFEELISNGWDAGASRVDVRISPDLSVENATMCVLDNGSSMDEAGLRALWHIAFSPKANTPRQYGRAIIGKFGIGKLATYVLASSLTYICKASDGKIRRVTMDFDRIDQEKGAGTDRLIRDLQLDMFEVKEDQLAASLKGVHDGDELLRMIKEGIPAPTDSLSEDDFGGEKSKLERPAANTWTLVVLSRLKPRGRQLKLGILRRMLQAALPFGSEMGITINGDLLKSSKVEAPILKEWVLGPELGIEEISIVDGDADRHEGEPEDHSTNERNELAASSRSVKVTSGVKPVPHVVIPGVGVVTGKVKLFEEKLTDGKSDARGASNGFFVNVLGRVINQHNPSFGEVNLSHAAWARFRMTVRADGLNAQLTTDREKVKEGEDVKVFRAFLRKVFNKARSEYDDDVNARLPDGGDLLVKSLGVLSLSPLRNVVSDTLKDKAPVPGLFDETGIVDREEKRKSWRRETADYIKSALGEVKYESMNDNSYVKFRIADSTIIVNRDHPFVAEHSRTKAEKELLRTLAMVELLADVYALDVGVEPRMLKGIRAYRDRLLRFRAMQSRQSGTYIAKLLLQMQHDSTSYKKLEAVVSDALGYLGYAIEDLANAGEPEGVARAYPTPTVASPSDDEPHPPLYSFTFDAKSSKHETAATGNIKLDGIVEHRERYKADYALVVAPGFEEGALKVRCEQQNVTPIKASDLGKLLEITVEHGAIPLDKLKELFGLHDWEAVSKWVAEVSEWIQKKRKLTIDVFIRALEQLKGKIPDALPASTLALTCRESLGAKSVKEEDVLALAKGLSILVPDIVGVTGDKIIVNASASRVAAAVQSQLERLHSVEDSIAAK